MENNELRSGVRNKDVYRKIECHTSEDREFDVRFSEKRFLDWLKYNPKHKEVEDYLVDYLNENAYDGCDIEGEEYVYIVEELSQQLKDEAIVRIDSSQYNL